MNNNLLVITHSLDIFIISGHLQAGPFYKKGLEESLK